MTGTGSGDRWETREWHPSEAVYMALAEEFGEDNDEDAIDAFTEVLVKQEVRVSLTRELLEKCIKYLYIWIQDEELVTSRAIARGELPHDFMTLAAAGLTDLYRIKSEW